LNELAAQAEERVAEEKRRGLEAREKILRRLDRYAQAIPEEERQARREALERAAMEAFPELWKGGRRGEALARLVEAETEADAQADEAAGRPERARLARIIGKALAASYRKEEGGGDDPEPRPETG
jgi:hypothetical protein